MSTRDIIEKWHTIFSNYAQYGYTAAVHARDFEEIRDDLAIALEEVALMEAVCEAVGRCGSGLVMDAPHEWRTVAEAYDALQAYRKERGL
jgi:uncharacterized membrane protein